MYADNNGAPGTRLEDSGNLSAATTGVKDYHFSVARTINATSKQIWIAIQVSNNSVGLRYTPNSVCLNYFNGSGVFSSLYIETQAFGAFQATATPTMYTNVNSPLTCLLKQ